MDIWTVLWTALTFVAGLIWSLIWFVLRDLISTALWLLILVWLILGVRYRSFSAGTFAMLRYGRYGFALFWRWIRRKPALALPEGLPVRDKSERVRARKRIPFGYMSVSEQLNMLIVAIIAFMLLA